MSGCEKRWGQDYPGCANCEPAREAPMDRWGALRGRIAWRVDALSTVAKIQFYAGMAHAYRRILDEMDRLERTSWPCQQFHGGKAPYIHQGTDERGECTHPECNPLNDDREEKVKPADCRAMCGHLESLRLHAFRDIAPGWVSVPEVEWDSIIPKAKP